MNPHLHLHFDHSHDGLFSRVARDLGTALGRMTGPALSQQQRFRRVQAEARNDRQGYGVL